MSEGDRIDGQASAEQVPSQAVVDGGPVAAAQVEKRIAALPEPPRRAALPAETSDPALAREGEGAASAAETPRDAVRPERSQGRRSGKGRAKGGEDSGVGESPRSGGEVRDGAVDVAPGAVAPAGAETGGEAPRPERTPRRRTRRQRPNSSHGDAPEGVSADSEGSGEQGGGASVAEDASARAAEGPGVSEGTGEVPPAVPAKEDASAPTRRERQSRGGRQAGAAKPVEDMGIEELVAQFSRRRRGRPSKKELQAREALAAAEANPTTELVDRARTAVIAALGGTSVERAPRASAETQDQPVEAEVSEPAEPSVGEERRDEAAPAQEGGYATRRRRHERRGSADRNEHSAASQDQSAQAQKSGRDQRREHDFGQQQRQRDNHQGQQRQRDGRQGQGAQGQQFGKNGRRNGRDRRDVVVEPRTNRAELEELKVGDLRSKANELGIDPTGLKKPELIDAVYAGLVKQEGFFEFKGILDLTPEGFGFIRTKGYLASENDVYIAAGMIRSNGLRRGDEVAGIGRAGRPNDKYPAANKVLLVNGKTPDELRGRPRFGDLTPIFPSEPLKMEHGKDSILGRCIDLVAPIGKGQRGLIVSPPKAGKTTVLKKIAESIAANNPEVHLICLLVDERPEEVTDMQRSIRGEVVASTFDMPCDNHITVSELVVERAKRLVEQGEDVVILLDSITRLARAYNLAQPASGRILSGGVDSTALYPPKRFLGAARNIENGGSLTILASALVDTGSKMDEVIFEEFKGTGNMELKLDRDLADRRIFPAIDPIASGTRKEELLLDPSIAPFVWGIRRILAGMNSNERAMSSLIKSLKATATNEEFLVRSAKKAQMQELNGDF